MKVTQRTIIINSESLTYTLTQKPIKNIYLRIKEGKVYVSAPKWVKLKEIDAFVLSKAEFIKDRINTVIPKSYETGEVHYFMGNPLVLTVKVAKKKHCYIEGNSLIVETRNSEDKTGIEKAINAFYKEECEKLYQSLLPTLLPLFPGIPCPIFRQRTMKSKWGVCNVITKTITLNTRLIKAPLPLFRYVFIHELCHLLVPNHSKDFHALIKSVLPNYKELKKQLNSLGYL